MAAINNRLANDLVYFNVPWQNKDSSTTVETAKPIEFADFNSPGTNEKASITNFDDLSRWLNNTERWIKTSLENAVDYREIIVNNIWTKHQKVPYSQFPRNIQETLTKLKKQGILTDLDSLTFEMARVLTVLDAASLFDKPTFSFVAVDANYDIDRHNLSFDATILDFPWRADTKVRLVTGASDLYATFIRATEKIEFQVADNYKEQAQKLVKDFLKFQTVQLTKGV